MPKPIALILLFAFLFLPFQPALAAGSRLTRATTAGAATAYGYGDSSERLQKVLPDGTSRTYLGELSEVDQTGAFTDYLFAGKLRIASRDQTGLYYHTSDHLSSASLITNPTGAIVQKLDYFPFGTERLNEQFASFAARFTYTDQERDPESGLLYYGARYYHPAIGRFTQVDSVVINIAQPKLAFDLFNPQVLNGYSYVVNNPLKYIDPEGEEFLLAAVMFLTTVATIVTMHGPTIGGLIGPALVENPRETTEDIVRTVPGPGDVIDAYEAATGHDVFSGEELSDFDKVLTRAVVALPIVSGQMSRAVGKVGKDEVGQRLARAINDYKINRMLKQVDKNGLASLGHAGSSADIREVAGTADDAEALFNYLRGENPVRQKGDAFIADSKTGQGIVTFRATSGGGQGPATVDVHGIENGVRKIKFVSK